MTEASVQSVSPWMSAPEAAAYAGRHHGTVRKALLEFVQSNGKRGLKGYQRKVHASWRIHRDDLDRWIAGLAPARGARRLARST